jgi:hypothetical protein
MGLGSGIRKKTYSGSGSRGQKGTGSRIRNTGVFMTFFLCFKSVCTSWEDMVWAGAKCAVDLMVETEIRQTNSTDSNLGTTMNENLIYLGLSYSE